MYPVTLRLTSEPIRVTVAARSGRIWPRSHVRILGASSCRSRTRTKIVNSSISREMAPLPTVRTGLLSDSA